MPAFQQVSYLEQASSIVKGDAARNMCFARTTSIDSKPLGRVHIMRSSIHLPRKHRSVPEHSTPIMHDMVYAVWENGG